MGRIPPFDRFLLTHVPPPLLRKRRRRREDLLSSSFLSSLPRLISALPLLPFGQGPNKLVSEGGADSTEKKKKYGSGKRWSCVIWRLGWSAGGASCVCFSFGKFGKKSYKFDVQNRETSFSKKFCHAQKEMSRRKITYSGTQCLAFKKPYFWFTPPPLEGPYEVEGCCYYC